MPPSKGQAGISVGPNPLVEMTPEQALSALEHAVPVGGFITNGSVINLQFNGNDAVILFARPQPLTLPGPVVQPIAARHEYTAQIHVSAATLKDFLLLLQQQVANYEEEFGPIVTDYTRRQAAKASGASEKK